MLDFYLIKDEQPNPGYPEKIGLKFIGGLDFKTFLNLQKKDIIDHRFDYYKNFRWTYPLINQFYQRIEHASLKADTDIKSLLLILDSVKEDDMGLIAYAD